MSFPQQIYYFQYNSGLGNTPYGKRHTSRTEPAYGMLNILGSSLHSPQLFCTTRKSLKSTHCCVYIPWSFSWISVVVELLTRITTLRRSCLTERRALSEAWICGNILSLSPEFNAKQHRWRENSYVFQVDQYMEWYFWRSFLRRFSSWRTHRTDLAPVQ